MLITKAKKNASAYFSFPSLSLKIAQVTFNIVQSSFTLLIIYNMFVTSKKRNHEFINSPIYEPKVLKKGQRPFLMVYYFLFITLKNIFILYFSF